MNDAIDKGTWPLITIDKGVPIPTDTCSVRKKYPWKKMEVGDSFLLPTADKRSVHSLASQTSLRHSPRKFIARKTKDGYRIWRIA